MKLSEGELLTALAKMVSDYQGQDFKVHTYCTVPVEKVLLKLRWREPSSYEHLQRQLNRSGGAIVLPAAVSNIKNLIWTSALKSTWMRSAGAAMAVYISLANVCFSWKPILSNVSFNDFPVYFSLAIL